jgi:DNA polymerase III epsilon subunit family exonuclease
VHIYDEGSTAVPEYPAASPQPKIIDLPALLPLQFIVLDLETTGLNPHRDEIIEFGAIRVTIDSDNHSGFQTLVRPERKVSRKITGITGITQDMVNSEGLQLEDALTQFIEFIGDLPLVTFNAEFDMGFLHSAAKKHGKVINNRYTCALKRARRAWPGLQSYRLVDLAKMGKLSDEDTHRALGDCKRTMIVFTAATSTLGQKVRWTKSPIELSQQNVQETD